MQSNHLTNNLLTKGWLDISILTKGFILPEFTYIIHIKRRGGFGGYAYPLKDGRDLYKDINKIESELEEIDYIEIFIDWNKNNKKYDKKIYVELIKKKIEVELIEKFNNKYKIDVKLIMMD